MSREAVVQPISSAAFDFSHYILQEPVCPVEKNEKNKTNKKMEFELQTSINIFIKITITVLNIF